MHLAPTSMLVGILSACATSGAVIPADTRCPGSVRLVAEARALVDSVLESGSLKPSAQVSGADSLLGVRPGTGLEALAPAGTVPELITDRQECESAAYQVLHAPSGARDVVVFRYGKGHIAVYDADSMRALTVLDESGRLGPGHVWIRTEE